MHCAASELSDSAGGAPLLEPICAWLRSAAVVGADGGVLSWSNPEHPGYRYPEAAGLLLSFLATEGPAEDPLRERILSGLWRDLSPAGGFGRNGEEYVFDTAMVLAGVLAHQRRGCAVPDPMLPRRLFDFVGDALRARQGARSPEGRHPLRWSCCYGPHLLKVAPVIHAYEPQELTVIHGLLADLLPLKTDGRFRIHARSSLTYVHAHCYAVEGLLDLAGLGLAEAEEMAWSCGEWLAGIQEPFGGLPAWHDGTRSHGPYPGDSTAQSIRIWACLDRQAFAGSITRGLQYLRRLQHPAGGLFYHAGSRDINTWVTVFAGEALRSLGAPADC